MPFYALLENQGGVEDGAMIGVRENGGEKEKEGQGGILGMLSTADTTIFLGTAWTKFSKRSSTIVDPFCPANRKEGGKRL